jgi:N-acetylmuramic acid 6-phosphate etherase
MPSITESDSPHRHLESLSVQELLHRMNEEDATVAAAVRRVLPAVTRLVEVVVTRMEAGGRLYYIGAGTSGRLGILDASECPPTFGVPADWVVGLIAGGDTAIRRAVEGAEDDTRQAWVDLQAAGIVSLDTVIGIAASGTTPYVVAGLHCCREQGIFTGAITCNPDTPLARAANVAVEVITGPEFITGSTRLKAGTAQKMVLNMITTATMIRLGRVLDNRMVDMQPTNQKLEARGVRMIMETLGVDADTARLLLQDAGSVRAAIRHYKGG